MTSKMAAQVRYLTPQCNWCGKRTELILPVDSVNELRLGRLVQQVFPKWPADSRELLITGTHPECWDRMFGVAPGGSTTAATEEEGEGFAWDRDPSEPCQIGTVGCSVDHDAAERDCETW